VRRATGGAAVLHQYERTYSLVAPLRSPTFPGGVVATYARVARGLLIGLRSLGVPAQIAAEGGPSARQGSCFATVSAQEIATPRGKLVGSAQLRRRGAFLQHGSILLRADRSAWREALDDGGAAGGLTCLEEELERPIDPGELDGALLHGLSAALGVEFVAAVAGPEERIAATRLRAFKYLSANWTFRGRMPRRRSGAPGTKTR
jgi:lipoate-protein ligase A